MDKILNFNSMISDYEIVNPEFARVKVYVCYAGRNRNFSSISEEVLEDMSKTIYGIPMVAEYDETNNCFKGHGGKVEISDKGIEFVQTTVPYGFVDPVTPVFYEEVTELDGMTKHNYLCCYAYLWYKRYPEVENVLRNQDNSKIGQSMEIHVNSYEFDEEDYCIIKDGHFSALCMLGVEPCFESASVTSKFSKEESDVWEEMINSFKKYAVEEEEEEDDEEEEEDYEKEDKDEEIEKEDNQEEDYEKDDEDEDKDDNEEDEDDDEDEKEDFQKKYEESQEEIMRLKAMYSDLQANYSELESEIIELRAYKEAEENKRLEQQLEENVFAKFRELEGLEGYADIFNARFELNETDLIIRLKALAFDNNMTINNKKEEKKQTKKFLLDNSTKDKESSDWDMLSFK